MKKYNLDQLAADGFVFVSGMLIAYFILGGIA